MMTAVSMLSILLSCSSPLSFDCKEDGPFPYCDKTKCKEIELHLDPVPAPTDGAGVEVSGTAMSGGMPLLGVRVGAAEAEVAEDGTWTATLTAASLQALARAALPEGTPDEPGTAVDVSLPILARAPCDDLDWQCVDPPVQLTVILAEGTEPADGGSADGGSADGGSTDGGSADGGSADGGSADGGSAD